eukprot:9897143-Karenia_brevis.AAC.1
MLSDQLQCGHLSKCVGCQTDQLQCGHLSLNDQLQCGHLKDASCSTDHASTALFDAAVQTGISIPKDSANKYVFISTDGHPSPVLFDGDCAAGLSHGPMSEVAVE